MPGATVTHRSMETVKSYIGMLRAFLWENRFDMSAWGEERGSDRRDGSARARSRYVDSDLRGNSVGRNVAPTHMKVPQVAEVAAAMMRRHDEMMLCIFQIGITTGMRRGEILGLTIQDVKAVPLNTKTNGVTDVRYFIVIRNRISDDDDRGSKTLRHPANSEQENASAFKRSRFEVDINEDLYNRIMAYYRRTRDPRLAGGLEEVERIRRATRATGDNGLGGNYYIFFHKWRGEYRLLSGQTVNNRLKSFFKEVGVITKNVSHCLRHTYAMHLAKYSKNRVGEKEVQTALRHASPTSTKSYFNMTEEEIQDMDRAFAAEFTSLVPAFKMPMGRTAAKANTEDGPTE
jgi:integrase/recombinase XerD